MNMEKIDGKTSHKQAERLKRLTETAGDTTMGKVLRQFWHPIALSKSVAAGTAKRVRLLSEDLTLYRGQGGSVHLVGARCAHRGTLLHTGWIEGDQVRCMYHGWKYDGSGQCTERPAERPGSEGSVRIGAYPVREYCGVIFTYMGKGAPPDFDLVRRSSCEQEGVFLLQRKEIWPCNWLQVAENSLDAVHVSFAHQMGKVGAFGQAIPAEVPEVSYEETSAGICQTAIRRLGEKTQVRVSDWTFPYGNTVVIPGVKAGDPWMEVTNWMVPVDDEHTIRISLRAAPSTSPEADEALKRYFDECDDYNSADHHDELFAGHYPDDPLVRLTSAQDYVALIGQGTIADRASECLGASDRGISMLRKILWREMDAVETGKPPKQWRRLDQPSQLMGYANEAD